jgi:hypothetical protein
MADEVFDGTDMVRQLFREGQSITDKAGDALPQRVVKTLNVIGFPGVLRDGFVLCRGNDPGVDMSLSRLMVCCTSNEKEASLWGVYSLPTCSPVPRSSWI